MIQQFQAKVVADSIGPNGIRLTSVQVTTWRAILAELNTHTRFARNSASSRAIPTLKQLKDLYDKPFEPITWGTNQKGMSAGEELTGLKLFIAKKAWAFGRKTAWLTAKVLNWTNLHKQHANRVIEPYMWHTVLITSTHWENFFQQRLDKMAQPEMQETARVIKEAIDASVPKPLAEGEWHLPYITDEDKKQVFFEAMMTESLSGKGVSDLSIDETLARISSARCARLSYLTMNGARDLSEDIKLCAGLIKNKHMSPLQHIARATYKMENSGNLFGWEQFRKMIPGEEGNNPSEGKY